MMPNLSARLPASTSNSPDQVADAADAPDVVEEALAAEDAAPELAELDSEPAVTEDVASADEAEDVTIAPDDAPAETSDVPAAQETLPDIDAHVEDIPTEADRPAEIQSVGATAAQTREVYASTFLPAHLPVSLELKLPASANEVRDAVRQAAQSRGVDPDIAIRVVLSEGGLTPATWTGDHGSSFGPFQLHYAGLASGGNAVGGLGDAFTAETRLRADDPGTWRQQVEWALDRASRDGWSAWHGAATVGIAPREGIGVAIGPTFARAMLPAAAHQHVAVPNQFAARLSVQDAYAACGPVAAVAIARFLGRSPTVVEALQLARTTGWTASGGMNGITNEKRLLDAMHIPSQIETALNWRNVQGDASYGTPVILSTPNHYWVVDDYDPITREYHVGQSGLVYRGGAEWMTAERIAQLGGGLNGALYIDHPLARPATQQTSAATMTTLAPTRAQVEVAIPSAPPAPSSAPHLAVAAAPPAAPAAPAAVSEHWWEDPHMQRRSSLHARPDYV